ncbi:heparan-alpha-glucosaminide N-acetyltransferase [Bosea sp. NPDC055594]
MSEQATASAKTSAPARGRIELLDLARGIALLAMFVYHFAYDLSFFRLIRVDVVSDPGWRLFARLIAGSFLAIVGFSLILATRNGLNRKAYAKRFAMVAGAALVVTIGTRFAIPENFIFFGILHHIALASLLALPFLRLPALALALVAAAWFALPFILGGEVFESEWLSWLGFGPWPYTADFVPLFPWFACVLAGMALGKLALARAPEGGWALWRARSAPARLVALGGRNSLIVYLVHQPLFIGALMLFMQLSGPKLPDAEAVPFLSACQRSCVATGTPKEACERVCSCSMEGLKREELWSRVLADALTPEQTERARAIGMACARAR